MIRLRMYICVFMLVLCTGNYVAGTPFTEFVDKYWQWRLEDAPEFASQINVHTYDAKVEQYTIAVLDKRKTKVDGFLTNMTNIKPEPEEVSSYDVLKDTLQIYAEGYKWKNYGPLNPVNFLEGLWTDPNFNAPKPPNTTYEDFFNYNTRLYGWGDQALNMMIRMRESITQTTTNNWVSINAAIGQIDDLIGESNIESPLYKPFNETLENTTLSEGNKTAIRSLAFSTIDETRKKFTALKQFLLTEYKNNTRQAYGVNSFKDGEEYYKACLKWHLSTDITPEEVHKLGLSEVDRIYREMQTVMDRLGFNGSVKQFFDGLKNDSKYFLKTPEETIKRFEHIINDRVKPKLSKYFKNIPDMPCKVERMPYDGPGGSYSFGTPDGSRPGVFYVNVNRPEDNPTYGMVALTLHEADPGHHLQDIYSQAAKGLPEFRKVIDYTKYFSVPLHFPFYTSYTEGWALYAESLGEKDQLDLYADDYELMGRYSSEIFRACRLVVDTGLHHYNWTRDEAIDYMLNYTSYSRPALTIEIDRYITWPGQACAYKIGELKIRELRGRAEAALGVKFNIQEFHSVCLDNGAVPLAILEKMVDDWISRSLETLESVMSDFYAWRLKSSPEFSTLTSYKYNDKLDSYKYEKFQTQMEDATVFLNRLTSLSRSSLTRDQQVSYDVLENMLATFIDGYKWRDYEPLNPFNFLEGWQVDLSRFSSGMPFNTQGDFINYIRRIELAPQQFEEMIALSKRAMINGHTSNKVSVVRIAGQIDKIISITDPELSEMYKPFNKSADTIFGAERASVDNRIKAAITAFNTKLGDVKKFINEEYIPKARVGFGVGTLPNGKDNYKACLKWHTSIDISPEEVHQKGKDEVARIADLIRKAMTRLGYPIHWSISQVYANMTQDPQYLLPTGDATLEHFRDIIYKRIKPKLPQYFMNIPDLPLKVQASVSDGIGGEYLSGSEDGSRPGIFYANVHRPTDNPTFKMVSLSLHEAIPGHHLAESYSQVSDAPAFRKHMEWKSYNVPYFFPFFNAYVEGWALYTEYLGEEMKVYQGDSEMLGRYSDEMLRACRLVIDTGIHYYNWSRTDAIDYMLNYTAESNQSAAIAIDRYYTWPGQACGYKIGELKIKELRRKAERELGESFDIRGYHYAVLRNGPMPLDVLENVVDDWIQSVKDTTNESHSYKPCPKITSSASSLLCSECVWLFTIIVSFMFTTTK